MGSGVVHEASGRVTQGSLFPVSKPAFKRSPPRKDSVDDVRKKVKGPNEVAASIILSDVEKYDGLPVIWARLFQLRQTERENHATKPNNTEVPRI